MVGFRCGTKIFSSLRRNKLRQLLLVFAVARYFMLIVLLAAGNGLKKTVWHEFLQDSKRLFGCGQVLPICPTKDFLPIGTFNLPTMITIFCGKNFRGLEDLSPIIDLQKNVVYNREQGAYNLRGVMPDFIDIEVFRNGNPIKDISSTNWIVERGKKGRRC